MFRDRLEGLLQREFDAHVNDLLSGSQTPSGHLHAQVAKGLEALRTFALEAVTAVAAQTAARVNRLSPVDRLPDEILVLSLLHLDNRDTFSAAKVSRRWRAISLSSPSLWAAIDLSCRPVEFGRRLQLFIERSQSVPLDFKFVMESTEIDDSLLCEEDGDDLFYVRRDQCVVDTSQQLGHDLQNLAMAPDVLRRVRTLDITSMISVDPTNYGYSNVRQPTQTLQLAAAPLLRRLRLNWAKPDVHVLQLTLELSPGAYDSVHSLALGAVVNLQEVLPRFRRVVDLSLWPSKPEGVFPDIQLADICEWMPQLRRLEVGEAPRNFASKPLVSRPVLHRLALHNRWTCDIFNAIAGEMDVSAIRDISLWDFEHDTFEPDFFHISSGPTAEAELSVYADPNRSWTTPNFRYCAEDGHGRRRTLHSLHPKFEFSTEITAYATVNANMDALDEALPAAMPKLVTLRVREPIDSFRKTGEVAQLSCPALTHIELYVAHRSGLNEDDVLSGTEILNWIEHHLKDFNRPLDTLRVVGARVESNLGALHDFARKVFFCPTLVVEKRTWEHSPLAAELFETVQVGPIW